MTISPSRFYAFWLLRLWEGGEAFIVIDGIDASGKTTQTRVLEESLERRGFKVLYRIHPSDDNFFGLKTRYYLEKRGRAAHLGAAFYYMLDVLRSTLLYGWRKGIVKIFTRYLMGAAYLPKFLYEPAYLFFATALPTSNLMFILDVTPAEAIRRLKDRGKKPEMFERFEDLEEMRARIVGLARKYSWKIIDAEKPILEIHEEIMSFLTDE